jgi:hypothetical protein
LLKEYRKLIYSEEISYNPRVLVVDFDKLVLDTRNIMLKVAEFLDIDDEEILTKATLNKVPLESDGVQFTGKINDDPFEYLPSNAIELLRYLYYGPEKDCSRWKQCWLSLRAFKHKYSQKLFHYKELCQRLLQFARAKSII